MKVIIAEKPELGKAIAEAIDGEKKVYSNRVEVGEYVVVWAAGHILKFKDPEDIDIEYKKWKMADLPIFFDKWDKKVDKNKKSLFDNIKFYISKATEVINAGDVDDEGQYLIDEIIEYCKYKGTVKRILVNDNNVEAIKKSFKKIENNSKYVPLGKSAEARALSDLLVGINLSRFFTLYHNAGILTVGRVQTPTLALVVNRDEDIKNHIKEKYYNLFYNLNINNVNVKLKHFVSKGKEINDKSIIENLINNFNGKKVNFKISKKINSNSAPLPFNLAKLQIEANKLYKFSSQKTQDITQSLREKHKAITYNRSDCEYLTEEHFKEAPTLLPLILKKIGLDNVSLDFDEKNKSKCFNDKNITAHHGIIPTIGGNLSEFSNDERKIYELIAKRYIVQFMPKEKVENTEATFNVDNNIFKVSSNKTIEKGYTSLYKGLKDDEEDTGEEINDISSLSPMDKEIILNKANFNIVEKETMPKKHYTEATLLNDMVNISKYVKNDQIKEILKKKDEGKKGENGSIGTPATRASIIKGLFDKGYLKNIGNEIHSTDLAKQYLSTLPSVLKNPDITALWWLIQEDIKDGKKTKEDLINKVMIDIKNIMQQDYTKLSIGNNNKSRKGLCKCPECKKEVLSNDKSYFCENYKECKFGISKSNKLFLSLGVKINDSLIKDICENKISKLLEMKSKEGKEFKAKIKYKGIENNYPGFELVFENKKK